jgi:hypothetical protein
MRSSTTQRTSPDHPANPPIKNNTTHDKNDKHDDLDPKTRNNNGVPDLCVFGLCEQPGAAALDVQAEPVAADEDPGCPAWGQGREVWEVDGADEPRVGGVEGCGEEDRGEEDEGGLEEVEG